MRLIDLHCDTVTSLFNNQTGETLAKNNQAIDSKKLDQADSIAQFFALHIDLQKQVTEETNPMQACLELIDYFYQQLTVTKAIRSAKNWADIAANRDNNQVSALLTIEEGGVLQGKLYNLRNLYRLGIRGITLCWRYPNGIGYPNTDTNYRKQGLTPFGKTLIAEMNRLGMLIDVSHLSDQGVKDVARLSSDPFIASHSNARAVKDHPRNLSDDLIKSIADGGGVIGINFVPRFLGTNPTAQIDDLIHHIKHIIDTGGESVVALGSDFDGFQGRSQLTGIDQVTRLLTAFKEAGLSQNQLEKIWYQNAQRVIKEVL